MGSFNLGPLSSDGTPKSEFHSVSSQKPTDVFSFSLDNSGNINRARRGFTADADVKLYRFEDLNGNGVYDDQNEQVLIGESSRGDTKEEAINIANQPAGYYWAEVSSYRGVNNTAYDLRLSTTPFQQPSNLLPVEKEVGALTSTQTFTDAEERSEFGLSNNDTSDIYHFVVNTAGNFSFSLTGLTADADIRLIQDSNGNRVVEPNLTFPSDEVLEVSRQSGTTDDSITQFLNPGDYYVQVYQYAELPTDSQGIGYTLTMAP